MSKEIYINNIPFKIFNFVENNENLIVAESLKEEFFGVSLLKIFGEEILCEQVAQDIVSCNLKIDDNEYKNIKFKVIIESDKKSKIAINVHSLNNPEPIIISKKKLDLISEDFVSHYSESKLDFSKDVEKIKEKDLLIEELENEILNLKRLNRDEKIITEEKVYKLIEQNIENKILNPETYEGSEIILKAVKSLIEENSEGKLDDFRKNLFEDLKKTSNDSIENAVKRIRRYVDTMSSGGSVAKQYAKGGTMDGDLNVNGAYLSGGKNLDQIFITSETDSQTLFFTESANKLSISKGNTISLSSINTTFYLNSSKYEDTYTIVQHNSASWAADSTTDTGVRDLTSNWESTYTTVYSNSSDWNTAYDVSTKYQSASGSFATNTALNSTSADIINYTHNNFSPLTSSIDITLLQDNSANWQSTYTTLCSNSASYLSAQINQPRLGDVLMYDGNRWINSTSTETVILTTVGTTMVMVK